MALCQFFMNQLSVDGWGHFKGLFTHTASRIVGCHLGGQPGLSGTNPLCDLSVWLNIPCYGEHAKRTRAKGVWPFMTKSCKSHRIIYTRVMRTHRFKRMEHNPPPPLDGKYFNHLIVKREIFRKQNLSHK